MFNKFPRECGPSRKVVNNIQEWLNFVNLYNGKKKAVYTSVYTCDITDDKADYNNITIDKIFFDFDDKSCKAWEECNSLHQLLLKDDIKHLIIMSGRGYHLYVLTHPYKAKNPKSCIYNSQHHFINQQNLTVDAQVIGNAAQLARVPNTYNLKGKRFCIPLTQEQFEKGDVFIKQLAEKQNFVKNTIIGNDLFYIKEFDYQNKEFDNQYYIFEEGESSDFSNYEINAPHCIRKILSKKDVGWKGRYLVILYFREMGYTKQEVFEILSKHLSKRKLTHCVQEERQLQYLFDRHDLLFPSCDRIMSDGFCKKKCEKYNLVIYKK